MASVEISPGKGYDWNTCRKLSPQRFLRRPSPRSGFHPHQPAALILAAKVKEFNGSDRGG